MTPDYGQLLIELIKLLGPAAPFVFFLWKSLDQCHDERVKVQAMHDATLTEQTKTYAEMVRSQVEASVRGEIGRSQLASNVEKLAIEIHSFAQASVEQHQQTMEVLKEIKNK